MLLASKPNPTLRVSPKIHPNYRNITFWLKSDRGTALFILLFSAMASLGYTATNTAVIASTRRDYPEDRRLNWDQRHREFTEEAKVGGIDVLLLGDSITDYWRDRGRVIWDKEFSGLRAVNFGLAGDRTQNVLWRITNGELTGIKPRVVVLMIGTNNLGPGFGSDGLTISKDSLTPQNTPGEIVAGVQAIIHELRGRIPGVRILLFGVLPRGEHSTDPIRAEVAEINRGLEGLAAQTNCRFFDMTAAFLSPDGTLPRTIMPDHIHPNENGYQIWANVLREPLRQALAGARHPAVSP